MEKTKPKPKQNKTNKNTNTKEKKYLQAKGYLATLLSMLTNLAKLVENCIFPQFFAVHNLYIV